METKVGIRAQSAVCTTEIIVVRSPGVDIDVRRGGQAMLGVGQAADDVGLEAPVTRAGEGTLSVGRLAAAAEGRQRACGVGLNGH